MRITFVVVMVLTLSLCACGSHAVVPSANQGPVTDAGLPGFLPVVDLPDSLRLLPPAPVTGGPLQALDAAVSAASLNTHNSRRWELARRDADLSFPHAAETYSCALGTRVSEKVTPRLYGLLLRTRADAGRVGDKAKKAYQRARPFMVNGQPTCRPEDEPDLRGNGSYPSGHASIGWAWALILVELAPDRADDLFARGRAFSESRIVCNVHWQSDIVQGRAVGAATVAQLRADPAFRNALELARAELAQVRASGLETPSPLECGEEKETLGVASQAVM